jgi:hypothetical protein
MKNSIGPHPPLRLRPLPGPVEGFSIALISRLTYVSRDSIRHEFIRDLCLTAL